MKTLSKNEKKYSFKIAWDGVPATVRRTLFETSLYESFFASVLWHIVGAFLIWAITFCLIFFGLAPKLFPTPKMAQKDIEFIIKNHHSGSRIKHSKIKSEQPASAPIEKPSEQIPEQQNKVTPNPFPTLNHTGRKNSANKTMSKSSKNTVVPAFSMPMPNLKSLSSGLGTGNGTGRTRSHASGSGATSSGGDINGAFNSDGSSSGRSGFDKATTKKMITTFDISPYVSELKRNIRWNWKAPKGNEGKRVELFLRIAKDGKLIILNVKRTSEVGDVDNAALNAVKKCLPLNPLPAKYGKNYLDVIFTFGSNSVGSRY